MIQTCEKCGGLYATEHLEMFAGTPCRCGAKRRLIVAPPEITSSEWVAARRETRELRKSLERLVKACKQVSAALDAEMAKPSDNARGQRIAKITNFLDWEKDWASHFGLGKPLRPKKPSAATQN